GVAGLDGGAALRPAGGPWFHPSETEVSDDLGNRRTQRTGSQQDADGRNEKRRGEGQPGRRHVNGGAGVLVADLALHYARGFRPLGSRAAAHRQKVAIGLTGEP